MRRDSWVTSWESLRFSGTPHDYLDTVISVTDCALKRHFDVSIAISGRCRSVSTWCSCVVCETLESSFLRVFLLLGRETHRVYTAALCTPDRVSSLIVSLVCSTPEIYRGLYGEEVYSQLQSARPCGHAWCAFALCNGDWFRLYVSLQESIPSGFCTERKAITNFRVDVPAAMQRQAQKVAQAQYFVGIVSVPVVLRRHMPSETKIVRQFVPCLWSPCSTVDLIKLPISRRLTSH